MALRTRQGVHRGHNSRLCTRDAGVRVKQALPMALLLPLFRERYRAYVDLLDRDRPLELQR